MNFAKGTRVAERGTYLAHLALSESGFLFNVKTGHTYTLNNTGTSILRMLIHGQVFQTMVDTFIRSYDVCREQACHDIERFLRRLVQLGLIEDGVWLR